MSLLDMVSGALGGGEPGGSQPLIQMLMKLVNDAGGLQGLLRILQEKGLAEQVASWVGPGSNLPVSGAQIEQALGQGGLLTQLAAQLGQSEPAVAGQVAKVLPGLVDGLSPQGQVPEGDLMAQGLDLLKGKLFG